MQLVEQVMIQIYSINVLILAQINVNHIDFYFNLLFVFVYSIDCSYPGSRFKDEVTEYYYGRDDTRNQYPYGSPSKPSFQTHLKTLDERYGQSYNKLKKGKEHRCIKLSFI